VTKNVPLEDEVEENVPSSAMRVRVAKCSVGESVGEDDKEKNGSDAEASTEVVCDRSFDLLLAGDVVQGEVEATKESME